MRKKVSIWTVTEAEARSIMKDHGWFYTERPRYGLRTKYIYAQRRQGAKMLDRYICPLSRLDSLTKEQLVAKLTQLPIKGQQPPAENL